MCVCCSISFFLSFVHPNINGITATLFESTIKIIRSVEEIKLKKQMKWRRRSVCVIAILLADFFLHRLLLLVLCAVFRSMVFICWILSSFFTGAFEVNISSCHLKSCELYVRLLAFEFIGLCRFSSLYLALSPSLLFHIFFFFLVYHGYVLLLWFFNKMKSKRTKEKE